MYEQSATAWVRTYAPPDIPPFPLIVDVDGTLVAGDLLHEAAIRFAVRQPLQLWRVPLWLAEGRAALKRHLAERAGLDMSTIPLRDEALLIIRRAQAEGRPVYLASAADATHVAALARRIGGIEGIFASDGVTNLAGAVKAALLVKTFGAGGFDYVGDSMVDLPVWHAAREAIALPSNDKVERRLTLLRPDATIIARPQPRLKEHLRAIRPHQWSKNLLLLVPVITIHVFDAGSLLRALVALLAFCCAASSAYLFNDLADLAADRAHARKRHRPLAAGTIPIINGLRLALGLLLASVGLGILLGLTFLAVLGAYVLTTLAYSLSLKRLLAVDVVTLGGLYTLRVFAGAAAIGIQVSPWLLMFCLFIFLSLAVVKRCSELALGRQSGVGAIAGRAYRSEDLPFMTALAAAAGYCAVLVFAFYLSSPEATVLYRHPNRLWAGCPILLVWLSRIVLLANRGEVHDDPIVFAFKDGGSLACGLLFGGIVAASI